MLPIELAQHPASSGVPLFSDRIPAGFPSPAADYEERDLDFNELLVRRKASTYCLRVSGDSMEEAGILDGDILVVDRSVRPADGDIIVASLEGSFTVKRLRITAGGVILCAENHRYSDIPIADEQDFLIFGVVTGVVRTMGRSGT